MTLYERRDEIGGSVCSAALTLPGFVHDVCSSVYPLAAASPFFNALPLARFGLEWIHPPLPLAHPFDDHTAVVLWRSVDETADGLGRDAAGYRRLMGPLVSRWPDLVGELLAPPRVPSKPLLMARFGIAASIPALVLARVVFATTRARALIAGIAAHAVRPLDRPLTSAFALVLGGAGHAVGWPFARGGAQRLADALGACLRDASGMVRAGAPVSTLDSLPPARAIVCDVTPRQLLAMAGQRLPRSYRRALARYRYGPGAFKVDWALDGPVPWKASECGSAGTVHVGGTLEEIAAAEHDVALGRHPERPFVLLAQPSICDPTRAPEARHTVWAYCHVPNGSTVDMTERIERQVERFAPGFRDRILARHTMDPAALESHNPNLVGGDVSGGLVSVRQILARPTWRHYRTPVRGLYMCSSATPPGGGVHGMCGYHAAQRVLRDLGGGRL